MDFRKIFDEFFISHQKFPNGQRSPEWQASRRGLTVSVPLEIYSLFEREWLRERRKRPNGGNGYNRQNFFADILIDFFNRRVKESAPEIEKELSLIEEQMNELNKKRVQLSNQLNQAKN